MRVQLEKLLLLPAPGVLIDITDFASEINVYQNIFEHYMQCDLVIKDSVDIFSSVPNDEENRINGGFSGGEILVIQYTAEMNTTATHAFALYERSSRTKLTPSNESYLLSGLSLEALESFPQKISRAYGQNNNLAISDMIVKIAKEFLMTKGVSGIYDELRSSINVDITKGLAVEETNGLHKYVIPNMTVDDTIEFLSNEAESTDRIPYYMFYENNYGFFFQNLGTLVKSDPVMEYWYQDFNISKVDKDQRKIITYTINKESNFLEKSRDGLFKSKTIMLDLHKKTKHERITDYSVISEKFSTLQGFKHRGSVVNPDINTTLITTRGTHDYSDSIFKAENHLPKRIDGFLGERRSYAQHIFNTHMTVTVPGTTMLNVGDCVQLNFPPRQLLDGPQQPNLQLTGKYIITKIRNKLSSVQTKAEFVTSFECVKDTQISGD